MNHIHIWIKQQLSNNSWQWHIQHKASPQLMFWIKSYVQLSTYSLKIRNNKYEHSRHIPATLMFLSCVWVCRILPRCVHCFVHILYDTATLQWPWNASHKLRLLFQRITLHIQNIKKQFYAYSVHHRVY